MTVIVTLIAIWQFFAAQTIDDKMTLFIGVVMLIGFIIYSETSKKIDRLEKHLEQIKAQLHYHELDKRVTMLEDREWWRYDRR